MSEIERDREVDAAWRAASREEPPAALDDAIRAEARRAVGSAPRTRSRHAWRYPAAAAATVALLAFGIAQMTSRDRVEPVVVADQPSASRTAAAPAAPATQPAETASAPTPAADAKLASPGVAQAPSAPQGDEARRAGEGPSSERFATPPEGAAAGSLSRPAPATVEHRALASAPAAAETSSLDELKAKEAGAASVDAWVARIRDLRARGELDAAAKDLAAFRAAYGERADALLPPDLRGK